MKTFVLLLVFVTFNVSAQSNQLARNAFMGAHIQDGFDYWNISLPTTTFHSAFKPYLSSTFSGASDSVPPFRFYGFHNFFLSNGHNSNVTNGFCCNILAQPILDLEAGFDLFTRKAPVTTIGGAHIRASINNNFTFVTSLFGGKSAFPFFIDTAISVFKVIPEYGQGYGRYGRGYTFFDYTGYLSFSPNNSKVFNFQLGRDKHFLGDGYRSLLLSDFSPAYPYLRINTNVWRLQYNVWYTWMYDVTNAGGVKKDFTNKFGTFHYLSFNITKNLNVGLFENVVWRGSDTNQTRSFDIHYLNPVIFFRPVEYSVGSPDNSFLGFNLGATILKKVKLYAQLAIDEFLLREIKARRGWWANKQGWQLGAKYINAFGVKGLKLQAEYNEVRPFTYTHGAVEQNYGHYGMPLAHPLGANFREFLGFIDLRRNNWQLSLQLMAVCTGKDTVGTKSNIGSNIFVSYNTRSLEYGNKTGQGLKTTIFQNHFKFVYYVKPQINARIEVGYMQRWEKSPDYRLQNPYIYLAFKTSFWNIYRNF